MFKVLKKLDIKFLAALSLAILGPFIYSWVRIFWIADQGKDTLAMASFQTYIQMAFEIIGAFILVPIFTYKNSEYKNNSLSVFMSVNIALSIMLLITMGLIPIIFNSMKSLNPGIKDKDLLLYLIFQTLTSTLISYEQYLTSEIIVTKRVNKAIVFAGVSIFFKVIVDILFLSNISPFEFNLSLISVSSFISTLLVVIVFIFFYFLTRKKEKNNDNISKKRMAYYYKKGIVPALELLIRNLFYALVTLKIVEMLGEKDWNTWNMGGFIYWVILFRITSVFDYSLLSESLNNDNELDTNDLMMFYLFIEFILFVFIGSILTYTYLPNVIGKEDYLHSSINLSMMFMPFMIIIGLQNQIKTKFLSENKYWYLLVATIIENSLVYLPLFFVINFTNVKFSLIDNYIIFGVGVVLACSINLLQYLYLINKIKFNKKYYKERGCNA